MIIGQDRKTDERRLFIDSSNHSLKAGLLHDGNKHPSIPTAYAMHVKETDETNYNKPCWNASDLKIVAVLLGMELGYTKCCCEWDSRPRTRSRRNSGKKCQKLSPCERNVVHDPLVDAVFLPPLHIKLGLVKRCCQSYEEG